jgi:tetratricopeptide (TPR) repeat protein
MTDSALLDSTLRQYEAALTQLEAAPSPPTEAIILDVLIGRDQVQGAIAHTPLATNSQRVTLYKLDQRLRRQSNHIAQGVVLADWRESLNPPDSAWWWKFPQPLDPRDRLDWLWSGLTLACLTASLSLLMDISSKFFESGPDLFGSFTVVSQSVLTLLAGGSALTQTGREATETLLQRIGFSKYRWNEAKFGIAAGLLLLLIGIHTNLPQIASLYSQWGRNNVQAGELSSAQNNYQRSLQLNPNNAKTRYSLGKVYDDLQKDEQAEAQYQLAVKGGVPQAYIRLSRLYILNGKPNEAIALLTAGEENLSASDQNLNSSAAASSPNLAYEYHTNLGWAYLKQETFAAAVAELQQAIQIDPNRGAAHCLLAQAWDAQNKPASSEWQACKALADRSIPEENSWYNLAQSRV